MQPAREWNGLLLWLKKVRVDTNRWGLLADWRQAAQAPASLFWNDIVTGGLRPNSYFLNQARTDLESLRQINPIIPSSINRSEKTEASQILALLQRNGSSAFERRSWSNEELDLLSQWIEIRDQTLIRSAVCVQSRLARRDSFDGVREGEPSRIRALKAWGAGRASLDADGRLAPDQRDISERAVSWLLASLGLSNHARFFQPRHRPEFRFYYDALLLGLIPRPTELDSSEVPPHSWRSPLESVEPLLAVLEAEGASQNREFLSDWLTTYRDYRDQDQPAFPLHPMPSAQAVRIALIDTGVDWIEHPDLGEYLGLGREGELQQIDFADGDQNSWAPATGDLAHGSGVMATLLTLMARVDSSVLDARKVDIALWKTASIRSMVAVGVDPDLRQFDLRQEFSFIEAFLKPVLSVVLGKVVTGSVAEGLPALGVIPDIVSVSALFPLQKVISLLGNSAVLKSAPWLWVMAAGNEGREVSLNEGDSCMRDLPEEIRPAQQIICVGSIRRGILRDTIASYSNYGEGVDLYTYDTYSGLCPSGTSCATPAISAALGLLKAKHPQLTPIQLRTILLSSAQEKALNIEGAPPERQTVRVKVFDPLTMMSRAYQSASRVVRGRSP
jgi:hypothetical protein